MDRAESRLASTDRSADNGTVTIDVNLDTWVSIAVLLGVGLSLMVYLRSFRAELKTDIAEFRTEVKTDIAELRTEVKRDIAELRVEFKDDLAGLRTELKGDILRLDERMYSLATGLRPVIENAAAFAEPASTPSRRAPRSGGATPRRA